ncbi:gamma-glutamyltransferase [Thiorhodococcus mannitoliphagus]|uniref:Gamma-glutamyltransferase n=1 Tax=Thiorhodococcus mannitoliphagus TaxID=329406 RepID=A0A6P1DWL0_9GAMM|nr:gamma-glutamyltransferase [Thiorhodococcus mannitoliphagus]NEX22089.1 gamma-glutamyltransferase [Thiorhodococcus mannitoliphagus]
MTAGSVAAGHPLTAEAAAEVLRAGGNAFDAVVAAFCAACVAEPVLASLGGGGFLLARQADRSPEVFDFFAQTPRTRRPVEETDFRPIMADFGDASQEFHIGLGAIATPGAVAGIFAIHSELCRLPIAELLAPASDMARQGVSMTPFQQGINRIIEPILRATPEALALFADPDHPDRLAPAGAQMRMPDLASALDALVTEGPQIFYRGEWAHRMTRDCAEGGGHLRLDDLAAYRVERRPALWCSYRGADVYTNPPPSQGGSLIGFTLALLEAVDLGALGRGRAAHIHALASAQELTQRLRRDASFDHADWAAALEPETLKQFRTMMQDAVSFTRGTTQISVADAEGNLASLTLSNGEGCGYVLPGTGIMVNNMLGEEDVNPHGFHRWPTDRRISSMMAPTLVALSDGTWVVTGSSGSNRIRSAILQVISNLVDLGLDLEPAVAAPRIHFEGGLLNLEPPVEAEICMQLARRWDNVKVWSQPSIFFGGAHTVMVDAQGRARGAGDPRRGGVALDISD